MDTNSVLLIVLLIVLALLAMFVIPQWRLKRAMRQVIKIFRKHNAIGAKNARTVAELGLKPRDMFERMLKGRDYRQYALNALMRAEIIKMTDDGKLYLSEDKLLASGFDKDTLYSR